MHKARVWEVPITESVICAVDSLAELQGYKTLKLQGKNKTRLLPGDWDEEDEYIYDDDYDDEDEDEDAEDEEDELETFDKVDKNEVDYITNDNNNNNNDVAEADGDNIVANPAQNNEIVVKDVNDDNKDDEESNENQAKNAETDNEVKNENQQRSTQTCNRPDSFTYDRMGQTHQQNTTKQKGVTFDDE